MKKGKIATKAEMECVRDIIATLNDFQARTGKKICIRRVKDLVIRFFSMPIR